MEYKVFWIIGILVAIGLVYWIYRVSITSKLESAAEAAALAVHDVAETEKMPKETARKVAETVRGVVKSHHKAHKLGTKRQY
jgi:cbb3-type cytochrome oxidase subunit 3